MAARQGCFCPGRGGGEGMREGSHLGWVPRVRESRVGAGVPAAGLAAAATAPGTGEAAMQTCPPTHAPGPASPNPPAPRSIGRDHYWGVGRAEGKCNGEGLRAPGGNDEGQGGLSQGQLEMTHSPSQPLPGKR